MENQFTVQEVSNILLEKEIIIGRLSNVIASLQLQVAEKDKELETLKENCESCEPPKKKKKADD